jgi:hypothetical protein
MIFVVLALFPDRTHQPPQMKTKSTPYSSTTKTPTGNQHKPIPPDHSFHRVSMLLQTDEKPHSPRKRSPSHFHQPNVCIPSIPFGFWVLCTRRHRRRRRRRRRLLSLE